VLFTWSQLVTKSYLIHSTAVNFVSLARPHSFLSSPCELGEHSFSAQLSSVFSRARKQAHAHSLGHSQSHAATHTHSHMEGCVKWAFEAAAKACFSRKKSGANASWRDQHGAAKAANRPAGRGFCGMWVQMSTSMACLSTSKILAYINQALV